jgi:hypothetical protein
MDKLGGALGHLLGILWVVAGPVTYIICVIDTWSERSSVFVKLLINLTLDAFLGAIWPITWAIWIVMQMAGSATPLKTVFGL